jgi:hypothetical protein
VHNRDIGIWARYYQPAYMIDRVIGFEKPTEMLNKYGGREAVKTVSGV